MCGEREGAGKVTRCAGKDKEQEKCRDVRGKIRSRKSVEMCGEREGAGKVKKCAGKEKGAGKVTRCAGKEKEQEK
ncbi:hypothetical protein RRG08_049361 [Elysia crispata]|uniref:Uncharacterized protein n=1 Tax=Elysia crispata TaxID=231223 RepID=A0AAE0XDR7_9GAST|nr:hypothetical protein RRG08_049361 [Elysia crispata]